MNELDPRPAWSREKYLEGDIRTAFTQQYYLAANTRAGFNFLDRLNSKVRGDIGEILHIIVLTTNQANGEYHLDEGDFYISGQHRPVIPVHRQWAWFDITNTHASLSMTITLLVVYRRKVPYQEG